MSHTQIHKHYNTSTGGNVNIPYNENDEIERKIHEQEKQLWQQRQAELERKKNEKKGYFEVEEPDKERIECRKGIKRLQEYVRNHPDIEETEFMPSVYEYTNTKSFGLFRKTSNGKTEGVLMQLPRRGTKLYAKQRTKRLKYVAMALNEDIKVEIPQKRTNSLFITLTNDTHLSGRIPTWFDQSKRTAEFIRFLKKVCGQTTTWVKDEKTGKIIEKTVIKDVKISYVWAIESQNEETHYPHIHMIVTLDEMLGFHLHSDGKYRIDDYVLAGILKEGYYYGKADIEAVYSSYDSIEYLFKYVYKAMDIKKDEYTTAYCLATGRRNWGASRDITKRANELYEAFTDFIADDCNNVSLLKGLNNSTVTYEFVGVVALEDIKFVDSIFKQRRGNPLWDDDPPPLIIISYEEFKQIEQIYERKLTKL